MSGRALFWATRETTSESAKTVHMEEMVISSFHCRPTVEISSRESSRVRAIISRKRPSAGALVVHDEVGDAAVGGDGDDLAVLPADVDDGAHLGVEEVGPLGVAGDLGDGFVPCLITPAVAGGDGGGEVGLGEACLLQGLLQGPLGPR